MRDLRKKDKSILQLIMITMLSIFSAELIFLLLSLLSSNVIPKLDNSLDAYFTQRVETRGTFISENMADRWGELMILAQAINGTTEEMIKKGDLTMEELNSSPEACVPVISEVTGQLISTMYNKQVSGVYVIFNTDDLDYVEETKKCPGIYIRDLDPRENSVHTYGDILLERAPISYVKTHTFSTDVTWAPMFSAKDSVQQEFMYRPFMAAYNEKKDSYLKSHGYWTRQTYSLENDIHEAISYTVPLVLEDGTVYGVLGVELLTGYLRELLPYNELGEEEEGCYLLGMTEDNGKTFYPVVISGNSFQESQIASLGMHLEEKNESWQVKFAHKGYTAISKMIELFHSGNYSANEKWFLIGLYPTNTLYALTRQISMIMIVALGITLIVGVVCIVFVSKSIAGSVERLAKKVSEASDVEGMPMLEKTGIREIDQFVSAITKLSHEIERERDVDSLTGIYGRRAFIREAERILADHQKGSAIALLMLDMDNLKSTNDKYGHAVGDGYIRRLAQVLMNILPKDTLKARISGDEFMVLLAGYPDKQAIMDIVSKLEEKIRQSYIVLPDGENLTLSVSGGVAWYRENGEDLHELMRMADFAMYHSKKHGKSHIVEFDSDEFEKAEMDRMMRIEFRRILRENQFTYHFQPIVDARNGLIYAYEMLLRMNSQILTDTETALRIAEDEKKMHDIERITFIKGIEQFRHFQEENNVRPDALVFVNSIADEVMTDEEEKEFLQKNKSVTDRIVVEITESRNMDWEKLSKKKASKIFSGDFALDDYGSGYNSEKNLLRLEPKYIKIDIMIVQNIDEDPNRQEVVRNITQYAHQRNMMVIAEGIETKNEMEKVMEIGVDLLQGYFLARPASHPREISPNALTAIREFWEQKKEG